MFIRPVRTPFVLVATLVVALTAASIPARAVPLATIIAPQSGDEPEPRENRVHVLGGIYGIHGAPYQSGGIVAGSAEVFVSRRLSLGGSSLFHGGDRAGHLGDVHATYHCGDGWGLQVGLGVERLEDRRIDATPFGTSSTVTIERAADQPDCTLLKAFRVSDRLTLQYAVSLVTVKQTNTFRFEPSPGGFGSPFADTSTSHDRRVFHSLSASLRPGWADGSWTIDLAVIRPDETFIGDRYLIGAGYRWGRK